MSEHFSEEVREALGKAIVESVRERDGRDQVLMFLTDNKEAPRTADARATE